MRSRRSSSAAFAAHLSVTFVWILGSMACDARAPEPEVTHEPPRPAQTTKKTVTLHTTSPSTRPSDPIQIDPNRCIKETPKRPERVVKGPVPNPDCPADDGTPPTLEHKRVEFPDALGGPKTVDAEIASRDQDRQRGLMFRTLLAEDDGMLFVFEVEKSLSFWMHNTCIPLDMIFIARDGTIVGIEENTPTLSNDTFSPGCPATYVLEMNAGWTRKNGIKAGMKIKLP